MIFAKAKHLAVISYIKIVIGKFRSNRRREPGRRALWIMVTKALGPFFVVSFSISERCPASGDGGAQSINKSDFSMGTYVRNMLPVRRTQRHGCPLSVFPESDGAV
jgi:hypothetical protein